MIKRLAGCIREFRLSTVLTLIFIIGEVVIECLIPFYTADLINRISAGAGPGDILGTGIILVVMMFYILIEAVIRSAATLL